jgi:hypothetical protein
MVKISQEHIKNWWLPLPPIDEQRAIIGHIAAETAKLDALRAATERTIALLKERRAALVAAAVTGRITIHESTEANLPRGRHEWQQPATVASGCASVSRENAVLGSGFRCPGPSS